LRGLSPALRGLLFAWLPLFFAGKSGVFDASLPGRPAALAANFLTEFICCGTLLVGNIGPLIRPGNVLQP